MYKCKKDTYMAIEGVVTRGGWAGIDSEMQPHPKEDLIRCEGEH